MYISIKVRGFSTCQIQPSKSWSWPAAVLISSIYFFLALVCWYTAKLNSNPKQTGQRFTHTRSEIKWTCKDTLRSLSPCLPVIRPHRAALGHPITIKEGHRSFLCWHLTVNLRWSRHSYLATKFSWRPTGTLRVMDERKKKKRQQELTWLIRRCFAHFMKNGFGQATSKLWHKIWSRAIWNHF